MSDNTRAYSAPAVAKTHIRTSSPLRLSELPTIQQKRPLNEDGSTRAGSDTFDFGSHPNSPTRLRHDTMNGFRVSPRGLSPQAADYYNEGQPHEQNVSPTSTISGQQPNGTAAPSNPQTSTSSPRIAPVPILSQESSNTMGEGADGYPFTNEPAEMSTSNLGRRSVQFARNDELLPPPPINLEGSSTSHHARNSSWDAREMIDKLRSSAFAARLKELTAAGGSVNTGQGGSYRDSAASSPTVTRQSTRVPGRIDEHDEGSDVDADAEETADEGPYNSSGREGAAAAAKKKKKRRIKRPRNLLSTPTTPRMDSSSVSRMPPDMDTPMSHSRLNFIRRSTMPEAPDNRGGLSEGEGRDQLNREHAMLRLGSWGPNRGEEADEMPSPSRRRQIGHFRRISVFGSRDGGVSDGDAMATPSRRPFYEGRASSFGANKWRQVKKTLKALGQSKKEQFDFAKSAELMAELRAGAPAVLMLASMMQRDEHGNKRIPVLLEQLRCHIRDSKPIEEGDSERHWLFTIALEYGNGPSKMQWTVKRTIREIMNLHWKYKLTLGNEKFTPGPNLNLGGRRAPKQPRFPITAFPYLRGARGLDNEEDEQPPTPGPSSIVPPMPGTPGGPNGNGNETAGENTAAEMTAAEGTATENEGRPQMRKKKSRLAVLGGRRKSSALIDANGSYIDANDVDGALAKRRYVEKQRRDLEKYLQEMISWLIFRADSNRLCRFLELSALGVRLAAEGSYHGKECYLHIQSSKGLDFRRAITPKTAFSRHSRKWFLVRQSYIVCVESPENMNIYDVYLVDPKFKIISKRSKLKQITSTKKKDNEQEIDLTVNPDPEKHHTLKILTSERKVTLFSRNQHIIRQFEESITDMLKVTPWHLRNRFGSFAPVRTGVHAQWLVDGRDYMWNVSRAINMARDVIYIHDWWLSPELYMRRPACISQKWRLDRLLQKKAREGVKVFIIVYRNVEAAVPIDSEYTKFSLLNLHPNIFVQRSPNQLKKNQFFFAHHEKICIVDHDVAFVGGIDLCFGRWDCPQHPVADDKPTGFENTDNPKDSEHCQLFPGKDYSNPRVQDFFRLNEPYEEMYDRSRVPRMPWHDVSMQVVGQPARDLTRHFVQRWNYVRRGRKPTRPTPFLLPPPDYKKEDLEALGLTGTCEVQILRSASTWSLGIDDTECSIQNAYVKMIEDSDHFVYIENQFFITSTETLGNKMVNRIGDALVNRAIKAYRNDEDWRAVVLIPLMPGFQNEVDEQDGTSVRLILQCQFRSICRGEHSIFGRLRAAGMNPEDYIQFFSLRQWGKIGNGTLTTEQLYIHAKVIVVDDRVALIGSANINERSMLGNRDSECAAVVRDTDMISSHMGGEPYLVGRFAHTLRLRLMREHLGLDVDEILEEERLADGGREGDFESDMDRIYKDDEPDSEPEPVAGSSRASYLRPYASNDRAMDSGSGSGSGSRAATPEMRRPRSFNRDVDLLDAYDGARSSTSRTRRKSRDQSPKPSTRISLEHKRDLAGYGPDQWKNAEQMGLDEGRDSVIVNGHEVLVHDYFAEGKGTLDKPKFVPGTGTGRGISSTRSQEEEGLGYSGTPVVPPMDRRTTEQAGLPRANQLPSLPMADDTDIGGPPLHVDASGEVAEKPPNSLTAEIQLAHIDKDCMRDPLNTSFYEDVWCRAADNNTKIYRRVFRCMPDNEVTNWAEYKEYETYNKKFKESMDGPAPQSGNVQDSSRPDIPNKTAGTGGGVGAPGPATVAKIMAEKATGGLLHADGPTMTGGGHHASNLQSHEHNEKQELQDANLPNSHPVGGEGAIVDPEKAAAATAEADGTTSFPPLEELQQPSFSPPTQTHLTANSDATTKPRRTTFSNADKPPMTATSSTSSPSQPNTSSPPQPNQSQRRRRRANTRGSRRGGGLTATDEILDKCDAEDLLNMTQGALVQFPYNWLVHEENNGNWLFQVDQVAPLQIYN